MIHCRGTQNLILLILISSGLFFSATVGGAREEAFAIYAPNPPIPLDDIYRRQGALDLKKIKLVGVPLISDQDIIIYDLQAHTFEVTEEAARRLRDGRPYAGNFALVCVGTRPIYWAVLATDICEVSFDAITIMMPSPLEPDSRIIRIQLGYPTREGFTGNDPRNDKVIIEALRKSNKLKE